MSCDALLFDLGGTLVDSLPDLTCAINLLRAELELSPLDLPRVRSYVGDGATALVKRALPPADFNAKRLARFLDLYRQHLCEASTPYPGIRDMLTALDGRPLAVVTNKPVVMARELLSALQLDVHFRVILGGDSCEAKKPSAEPLMAALEQLGARPGQALMIGDHHTDLRAAAAAGVPAVFCEWGYGCDGGETPLYRAESVAALHAWLAPQ